MRSPNWAAAGLLALALTGCHAIYGHDHPMSGHGGAPDRATGNTPGAGETTPADAEARPNGEPSGGSGATVAPLGGAAADRSPDAPGGRMAVTTIAGTLAGGYFGERLGSRFDDSARQAAASAERQALANNSPADWSDPSSGASGRVRPLRSFTDAAGRPCREYSQTVNLAGRRQSDTGIACRQSDGSWSLVGS
jgi:surface antigen